MLTWLFFFFLTRLFNLHRIHRGIKKTDITLGDCIFFHNPGKSYTKCKSELQILLEQKYSKTQNLLQGIQRALWNPD